MTRDYIESACVSHYHVIATIEIRKRSVELIDAYARDPVDCTRGLWFVKTSRTDKNFSSAWCVSLLIRDSLLQPEVTPIHGLGPRRKARQPGSDWGNESRSRLIELSESMPLRRNDDAVRRVEKGSESCFPPEDTSLLADPSACPSRVRGASDLHGNSAHTRTAAA
jgi:hypothetical protein